MTLCNTTSCVRSREIGAVSLIAARFQFQRGKQCVYLNTTILIAWRIAYCGTAFVSAFIETKRHTDIYLPHTYELTAYIQR